MKKKKHTADSLFCMIKFIVSYIKMYVSISNKKIKNQYKMKMIKRKTNIYMNPK